MYKPTEKEEEDVNKAVLVLKYCCCFTMAHMELVECLVKEGRWRHSVKRRVSLMGKDTDAVYKECCRVFLGEDSEVCDEFGRRSWALLSEIKDKVGFSGSEKWYQIMCALSRLIEIENNSISPKWRFLQAKYLYNADKRLSELGYENNDVVTLIIKQIKK